MSMRLRTLLASAALVPALYAPMATVACAQASRSFEIAAGSLDRALVQYAAQADLQVLYSADIVAGRTSPGLSGRYTSRAALDQLLRGTGLNVRETRPGVLTLRPATLAETDSGPTAAVEDVIVTGSLIRGPGDTPSPLTVITRDQLDRQGDATVADALVRLPQSYSGRATPGSLLMGADALGSNTSAATGVNLRGLGEDATLVLVNGRRLAGTGSRGEFADLSALPGAAVERIDVLLDGASALYGSDAVGGVVNVILRRDFDGQESRLRYAATRSGAGDLMASHLAGRRWSSGSALISYDYQKSEALNSGDRDYTATGDLRPFGGTDHRTFFSVPGTIVRFDAVQAAYVAAFAVRPGPDGVARSSADFVAGGQNLSNRRQGVDILPEQERQTVYARVRQDITPAIELSADLRYSARDFAYNNLSPATIFTVTRANPSFVSPNGSTSHQVAYNFIRELGPTQSGGSSRSLGVTAGFDAALPRAWSLEGYLAYAEELSRGGMQRQINTTFVNEALGSTADNPATPFSAPRDGYLNLFGSGAANSAAVLDFISQGYDWSQNRSRVSSANLLADGVLMTLPGGELKLAVGGQARREDFRRRSETFRSGVTPTATQIDPQVRDIVSVFAEARIPLFGENNARPGLQRLELSIAGRAEEYDDVGSTANPKVGVIWDPVDRVRFRASWGTSFRAPALTEVFDRVGISATSVDEPSGTRLAVLQTGGNLDLKPETAESFTLGFDLKPVGGFRLSGTYFDTRYEDRIARPATSSLSTVLTDPSLSPFITRLDPTNAMDLARIQSLINDPRFATPGLYPATAYSVLIDGRWANTGELHVRGIDGSAGYGWSVGAHRFDLEASGSYMLEYSRKQTPLASREQLVDLVGFPIDLRLTAALNWSLADWSARIGLNYADRYRDAAGVVIDAWTTADANLRWAPTSTFGSEGVVIAVNIQNLTDEAPPFYDSAQGFGFDPGSGNPLGRVVSLQLIKRW